MPQISRLLTPKVFIYEHNKDLLPTSFDFHLHDRYEIYFFISGNVNYLVEKNIYPLSSGDLLVMNSKEIHKATFTAPIPYERCTLHFSPSLVYQLNTDAFNLLRCFEDRPSGEHNRIQLSYDKKNELLRLFKRIEELQASQISGYDVLTLCCLVEILVLINTAFSSNETYKSNISLPSKLTPILEYIDSNLDGDLSLQALEAKFYINRYYLCRLFKSFTGSSIHEYILYKRVSRAKMLLSEGVSVTDTCMGCGFGDYSNFIRSFKNITGITPGKFAKSDLHNPMDN